MDVRENLRRMGVTKLEDTCTQKRRLEDGHEGGQDPTRTVEPWSSSSIGWCAH